MNNYNPPRTRNLYDPGNENWYRLSRSRLENFINCPRCFYMDRRLGVEQPPGYPFNLNKAVDKLLKKEFDIHRAKKSAHPLMKHYKVNAVPFAHPDLDRWRSNFDGISYRVPRTNLELFGAIDDVWMKPKGELIIVDYKATSKEDAMTIDEEWQGGYKRQMEIYQWLFTSNGFKVDKRGYFVYCNGKTDRAAFDGKLEFDIELFPYDGDTSWVEKTVGEAYACLQSGKIPPLSADCDFCKYRKAAKEIA